MTKAEFIQTLREKLMGEVSSSEIENTIRYYENYIEDAKRNGKPEETVLEELGSPILIARTIVDTGAQTPKDEEPVFQEASDKTFRQYDLNATKTKIVLAVVVILVLFLIFTILRVLIPIVVPILLVYFIIRLIQKGGRR